MVHHRINEKQSNSNPHINFITALPASDDTEQAAAIQLLRALAAQVRPIMKSHGFIVNSLEEYEHNNVFAGRNWNAGETVELVLRRPDRTFAPTFWLMSTLCHELAHIKHMNHGPAFQALWKQLRAEVRALQDKGYYGDGYWSSGTRLADSSRVAGQGIEAGDLPEYMCGGAQTRKRPAATRRRRTYKPRDSTIIAANTTGRQTAKRRKAGVRVTSKSAFVGEGTTLSEGTGEGRGKGSGFGKQAASKRAREERALATERRLFALQNQAATSTSQSTLNSSEASESESADDDDEDIKLVETDSERRQNLITSGDNEDLKDLESGVLWEYFENDFNFGRRAGSGDDCDLPSHSGSTATTSEPGNKGKRKATDLSSDVLPASKTLKPSPTVVPLGIGKIVQSEINFRKKESLGMTPVRGGGRVLSVKALPSESSRSNPSVGHQEAQHSQQWNCLVCTLSNEVGHLACSACTTPRGEKECTQK